MSLIQSSNIKEFTQGIRDIQRATNRDSAEIINRALLNVAYRAAEFTPKSDPAKIEASLIKDKIALKMVTKKLKAVFGVESALAAQGFGTRTKTGKMRKVTRVSRKLIGLRARQLIAARKKVVGYLRAGWFPAIRLLGGSIRGSGVKELSPASELGSAKLATVSRLFGQIANHVFSKLKGTAHAASAARMEDALDSAIRVVAIENTAYAKRKIRQTLRRA